MRTILFSPLGNTDPISNDHDGSMLHICRIYKPDKVILYMSASILEEHQKDDRYLYCLNQLVTSQGKQLYLLDGSTSKPYSQKEPVDTQKPKTECEIIERPDLVDVQRYNDFYDDFSKIIKGIHEEMQEGARLLLNIASGTPAMKSALLVIQHLGEYDNFISVQVKTPIVDKEELKRPKHGAEHGFKEVNWKNKWENNNDKLLIDDSQLSEFSRCDEVHCDSLLKMKNEEMIKQFVEAYQYESACMVAEKTPGAESYRLLLEIARARSQYRFREVNEGMKQAELSPEEKRAFLPQENSETRQLFEYALISDLKRNRKEYADFIRSLSPLIMDLFEKILKKQCGINIEEYCDTDVNGSKKWSEEKLKKTEAGQRIIKALSEAAQEKKWSNFRFDSHLISEHIKILVINELKKTEKTRQQAQTIDFVGQLRAIEEKIRNLAAHEIILVTEEVIRMKTGSTSSKIIQDLRSGFICAGMNIKKEDWDSYAAMNEVILARMK